MSLSTPSVSLRAIQGKGHVPFQKRERRRREKAGGFQGNGGNPAIRTGKRLAAGRETGTSRYRARDGCGSGAGNPRECALLFARLKIAGDFRSLSYSCWTPFCQTILGSQAISVGFREEENSAHQPCGARRAEYRKYWFPCRSRILTAQPGFPDIKSFFAYVLLR